MFLNKGFLFICTLATTVLCALTSCQARKTDRVVHLVVSNPTDTDVVGVVSGLSLSALIDSMHIQSPDGIALIDEQGKQIATQVFDNGEQQLLLFECSVLANGESSYIATAGSPLSSGLLPVASQMKTMRDIRFMADTLQEQLATTFWAEVPAKQHQIDSLMQLLDVSVLGGYTYPYPGSLLRNPWKYQKFDILTEGPLLCAYQIHSDTLAIANDTLLEHRTLVLQKGSSLMIVRDQYENVGRMDTLLQLHQLAVSLPCLPSDSLVINEPFSYLAIQHADSTAIGMSVPVESQPLKMTDSRQAAFLSAYSADSILTYFVASNASSGEKLTLQKAEKELQQLHEAPLSVRIVVQE